VDVADGDRPRLGLLEQIREDRRVYDSWTRAGFHAVAVYRIGVWRWRLPILPRMPITLAYLLAQLVVRNVYSIEITSRTRIGRRLRLAHQGGVSIHPSVVIGDDCLIRQNVTIGIASNEATKAPTLGDRVEIGAGAVIIGGITIGDDARVGPNAVVTTSVPANGLAVAPPARIIPPPQ
jgi:serine O-acetyltransferase